MTPEKRREQWLRAWGAGAAGRAPQLLFSHLTTGVVDPLPTNNCFAAALQTSPPCHDPDRVLSALALQC